MKSELSYISHLQLYGPVTDVMHIPTMNICPAVVKRVQRELCILLREEVGGINVKANYDLSAIEAEIFGPESTPFYGGVFIVKLVLDVDYPET